MGRAMGIVMVVVVAVVLYAYDVFVIFRTSLLLGVALSVLSAVLIVRAWRSAKR